MWPLPRSSLAAVFLLGAPVLLITDHPWPAAASVAAGALIAIRIIARARNGGR